MRNNPKIIGSSSSIPDPTSASRAFPQPLKILAQIRALSNHWQEYFRLIAFSKSQQSPTNVTHM